MTEQYAQKIIDIITPFIGKTVIVTSYFPDGRFWQDEAHVITDARSVVDDNGMRCVYIEYHNGDSGASGQYIHKIIYSNKRSFITKQNGYSVVFELMK